MEVLQELLYLCGFVDIWFYEENSTHLLLDKYIFDKRHLFPLTRRPFGDRMSWAACDPVRSLEDIQVNVFDCVDEKPWKRGPVVPCSEIEHMYPMVRRVPVSGDPGAVDEMLMFRGMVLKRVRLRYGTDCWSSNPDQKKLFSISNSSMETL